MELSTRYNAAETEAKWYKHWQEKGYFHSTPNEKEPYTIVLPPPNVTGVLHMGHLLNITIHDVLIRKARLDGKNACWVPGTDHASIATENKVIDLLKSQGIKKSDISREEFLKHAFAWKEKYGGIIIEQLKLMGASCDWERTRFTMEDKLSNAVTWSFVDLYRKGYIYKGLRMCNWDCEVKTALGNEEVIHSEETSKLFFINYPFAEGDGHITIATTRPETIMADVAIAINPKDERYTHLVGKMVKIPLLGKAIPIIADSYVKMDFGTGALKITPAHDLNDFEVGRRHNLEVIDILNEDGTLNEKAQLYVGKDRFIVRKIIAKDLEAAGFLAKTEEHLNKVGRSERNKSIIEPRLTEQWFLKMDKFAASALAAVENGEVNFLPKDFLNMYRSWLQPENVRDWCISRQLWWGQQIPAYYTPDGKVAVANSKEEALAELNANGGTYQLADLKQDEDVVDTWFSSWLWPLSVFDAFEKDGDKTDFRYYYPTNVLITGWDIMFFWVARMIMAGYEWAGDLLGEELAKQKGVFPFKDVYFTGMVRDKLGRKMSKNLGNSPDSLVLIEKYSADGVRFGMLSCSSVGNDVIFDADFDGDPKLKSTKIKNESKVCEIGRNFTNKLWNALRMLKGCETTGTPTPQTNQLAMRWLDNLLQKTIVSIDQSFAQYRLSEALMTLYNFIWDDFCSWYLEWIKPAYQSPMDKATYDFSLAIFKKMLTLLHPFMPFITEELWAALKENPNETDCILSSWPKAGTFDNQLLEQIQQLQQIIIGVREVRNQNQLSPKQLLKIVGKESAETNQLLSLVGAKEALIKLGFFESLELSNQEQPSTVSFLAGAMQFAVVLQKTINIEEERSKLAKELEYVRGFVATIEKKLSNDKFVQNAKPEVVEFERRKLADNLLKINLLEDSLAKLN